MPIRPETNGTSTVTSIAAERSRSKVFVSHASLDDDLPSDARARKHAKGFVSYLVEELRWMLGQRGLGRDIWLDTDNLRAGNNWKATILEELRERDILLAIVSPNFIDSDYCKEEVSIFWDRLRKTDGGRPSIFRIDKYPLPANDSLPECLRDAHAIPFYDQDPQTGHVEEYYWRGKTRFPRLYEKTIRKLAEDIRACVSGGAPPPPPPPPPPPGLTVYLAKPGVDLTDAYQSLVRELQGRGHTVVPDPASEIPDDGDVAAEFVRSAMARANLSVHLVGEREGKQPDGLTQRIVPWQLALARETAAHKAGFHRLIWAPKILPGRSDAVAERDAVRVLANLDRSAESDELVDDTAARFKDVLLQRLSQPSGQTAPLTAKALTHIYLLFEKGDRPYAMRTTADLKALGARITAGSLNSDFRAAAACDHVAACWGEAGEAEMLAALASLRPHLRENARIGLLIYPPATDAKQFALDIDSFGEADLILDASESLDPAQLAPLLAKTRR